AQRHWLDRGPDVVVADLCRGDIALLGNKLCDGQTTKPALARPHAATAKCLGLIRPFTADLRVLPDLSRSDLFTAANHHCVLLRNSMLKWRPIQGVEKRPDMQLLAQVRRQGSFPGGAITGA